MEITLVGMKADTSLACVSMTGNAVSEPPPCASFIFAARSSRRAGTAGGGHVNVTSLLVGGIVVALVLSALAAIARSHDRVREIVAEAGRIGAPAELSRRMFVSTGLVAVRFSIDEVFDQTPGPTAGRRL